MRFVHSRGSLGGFLYSYFRDGCGNIRFVVEDGVDSAFLPHISPIGWDNIVLYGEYALDRSLVAHHPRHGRELGVEN